ncbi:hypothetical protein ACNFIA_08670 [Pseudomonas sp. NY15437]|uniref:hypothetical protein n=1 Tax=unclassified Pseudomonas TaxID=196821 RepID=UPI00223AE10C|nr:hypothetical protein [Pseudomonas sp. GCEP-101]
MNDSDKELKEAAVAAFLLLVPALAQEIERTIPLGSTPAERHLHRQRKGWAELCESAQRTDIDPLEFARQVVVLYQQERRRSRLN